MCVSFFAAAAANAIFQDQENDTIGILVSTAVDITVGSRNIKPAGNFITFILQFIK